MDILKNRLALGTVQLGLSYGINNKTGKPDQDESTRILDAALKHNIRLLDSADAYGDSLRVIGSYLNSNQTSKFEIISKFSEDGKSIHEKLNTTLKLLNRTNLYAYMYHRFDDYLLGKSKLTLLQLKAEGLVKKIGVSVYGIEELRLVVENPDIDLIQIPFNPFDSSIAKRKLLAHAKSLGKEIHVRSIFLQGLFFKKPEELTGNLIGLAEPLKAFQNIVMGHNMTIIQTCLNFALHSPLIDRVIIGVEKYAQLEENLKALLLNFPDELTKKIESIIVSDTTLLNPSNWKP